MKPPSVPITTIKPNGLGRGAYQVVGGSAFNLELNVFDAASERPIRAVEIESGLTKGFTDRLGRLVLWLPRGKNLVVIEGSGYVEKGDFTPETVKFDPLRLEVDLDSDAIYTIYSSGEIVQGERRVLKVPDNPGHNSGELEAFLRDYWWAIGLVGATGLTMYYIGKSRTPSA